MPAAIAERAMSKTNLTFAFCTSALLVGCATNESETSGSLSGSASYRDATTDHNGAAQPQATPSAQSAHINIIVKGTGTTPTLDPKCAIDPAGSFEAHYLSTMSVSDGKAYNAA